MGISGLLPMLKEISEDVHLRSFADQVAAIDSYCWIHKAAIFCAEELMLGKETSRYVDLCMKYVDVLLANKVRPIMVFDGFRLDAKREVEYSRKRNREEFAKKGLALWSNGEKDKAREAFKKAVDVTSEMALKVIEACREKKIQYLVAPFEADAQLTYLSLKGFAQLVISEDSDLLVFGCKQVLYKMGMNGTGKLIKKCDLNKSLKLKEFTFEKFRHMCILSGCDYASSLRGIGLKRAKQVVEIAGGKGMSWALQNIGEILKMPTLIVPESYFENFFLADNTFQHQSVFDPLSRKVVPLSGDASNEYFLSRRDKRPTDEFATDIAIGNINVQTGTKVRDFPFPSAKTEMLSLSSVANRETEEDPIELLTVPNSPSATVLAEVVNVEKGTFLWTVPCLPVLSIEWRRAKLILNGVVNKALFRASDHRLIQLKTPVRLTLSSSCPLEIEHENHIVIWEWDILVAPNNETGKRLRTYVDSSSSEDDVLNTHISGDTEDDEADSDSTVLHTLPFKVMGVAHKLERQQHLEAAFNKRKNENFVIRAKIEPEPDNMFDEKAISVLIDYGFGFKHVGYIAQELTKFVHPVLQQGRLQHAAVYDIKFRTAWAKTGYFMTLQLTSKGEWPSQVLRASSRVQ